MGIVKRFSITDVERLSGIKAHTLRTWELRYSLLQPDRSSGHARRYSLEEVNRIIGISILNRNGSRVSRLASLSEQQLAEKLNQLPSENALRELDVKELLYHMFTLNITLFEKILDTCFKKWTTDIVFDEILIPYLQKTGLYWKGTRSTEEHFVVAAIRNKIISAIEGIKVKGRNANRVLLFLPDTRQLDLALLYTCYRLKSSGISVLYMGNDVSILDLCTVLENLKPSHLFTYLPENNCLCLQDLSEFMNRVLPQTMLIFSSSSESFHAQHSNVIQMDHESAISYLCSQAH